MPGIAEQFIEALHTIERERDVESMVRLCDDNAVLTRAPREGSYSGKEGARTFWSEYLHAFPKVCSTFRNVIDLKDCVVLEWHTSAIVGEGRAVDYDGCSIIEANAGRITSFRTYYDAAHAGLGRATSA